MSNDREKAASLLGDASHRAGADHLASAPAVSILYEIEQDGWAKLTLRVEEEIIKVGKFVYCTDALGDLIRSALSIVTGGMFSTVSFDSEPLEWRLSVGELWPGLPISDVLPISIRTFPDISDRALDQNGHLVFEAKVDRDAYGRAVLSAAQTIWEFYGANGYAKAWDFTYRRFPLRALEAALLIREPDGHL